MNVNFDPKRVTEVLLNDGWHDVLNGSLDVIDETSAGTFGVVRPAATWREKVSATKSRLVFATVESILAVRYHDEPTP